MPVRFDQSVVCPVVVGREDLLAALGHMLEQARGGQGQVALITGEAGIGKSRLLAEAKARAVPLGLQIVEGHCYENDAALPYAPLLDLLRGFCATHSSDELTRSLSFTALELVKLLPELATRLPDLAPTPALEPAQEKHRLFESLTQFLLRLAALSPFVIVVEDLQWSDVTSLDFLLHLARRVTSQPMLLWLTCRSDETNAGLTHFLAELDRERLATALRPQPLSIAETEAMLRAIFELARPVRADFLNAIHTLTEGNPFFIEETLKALITTGEIFYTDGAWDRKPVNELHIPPSVQDAVQRRAAQLSEPARRLLTLAAVAGRRFDFGVLQELVNASEPELVARLKELVAAQLVVEESADQFSFRHALTREAITATLLRRERQTYHRVIAETLERLYADSLSAHLADLSYHFYEAARWEKALVYSQQAGEQAQKLYAPREAIGHFSRALTAAQQLTPTPAPLPRYTGEGTGVGVIYRARGKAYETLGDFESARADYDQVLRAARAAQDRAAEWQGLSDLGFLWEGVDYERAGEYFQRALELARAQNDPVSIGHSLNRIGNWWVNVGQTDESLRAHREALEFFEQQQDKSGMAETLDLLSVTSGMSGDVIAAQQYAERAIALFRELSDKPGLVYSRMPLNANVAFSETLFWAPRSFADCERDATEALDLARQIYWFAGQVYVEWTAGMAAAHFGEFGRALARGREALRIASEIDHRQWTAAAHHALGYTYLWMLQPNLAIGELQAALAMAHELRSAFWIGTASATLALVYLLKKDMPNAQVVLEAVQRDPPRNVHERRIAWAKGCLLLARGDAPAALRCAEQLIESAPGKDRTQPIPALLKLKGDALYALRQFDQAQRAWEDARRGAVERGARPLLWQIHADLARVYQRLKRAESAERALASAQELIRALAATLDDTRLQEDFARAAFERLPKTKPLSPRRAAKKEYGGLTVREREIAALIAAGKSNRAIADVLVVSERTVEGHVAHILAKLDFASRAQIAVWAAEKGLVRAQ